LQKLDTKAWIEAAQTYQRLYHLCWLFNFGYIGAFVLLAIGIGIASANNWDAFAGALFLLYLPISCILGLGIFITWLNLRGFRCPRCGERFNVSRWNRWPTYRCRHCWLDLGVVAKDHDKSPALGELWE
jgi:disulfide bond formation protein DsbB